MTSDIVTNEMRPSACACVITFQFERDKPDKCTVVKHEPCDKHPLTLGDINDHPVIVESRARNRLQEVLS
jgi:hypothetical protein